jgi:hypothetical protein
MIELPLVVPLPTVSDNSHSQIMRNGWVSMRIAAFAIIAVVVVVLLVFIHAVWNDPGANEIVALHVRVIIGLPVAGLFLLVIIALFRSTEGTIKFEALGFKFEGASGPIVMWVICFLAISGSIRLLW